MPVTRLADKRLQVDVPHFSVLVLFTFPTVQDLQKAIEIVVNGVVGFAADFIDAPYECPAASFSSSLVDSTGYPSTVDLQVDVSDVNLPGRIVKVAICNKLRFAMEYRTTGAADMDSLALPRSTVPLTTPLHGGAGDPFVVDAELTPAAIVATLMFVAFEALPDGHGVVAKLLERGLLSSTEVTLIANNTRTCGSALATARAVPSADSWRNALDCLRATDEFWQTLVQIATEEGVGQALTKFRGPVVQAVMGGQAVNRLIAEWIELSPQTHVTFPYRLRCGEGDTCAVRTPAKPGRPVQRKLPDPEIPPTPPMPATGRAGTGGTGSGGGAGAGGGSPCPNGMVGPGPDGHGHSGCYVQQAAPSPSQPRLVPPADVTPVVHPHAGLDVSSGPPGTAIKATGGGFLPNAPITASESGPVGKRTVGTITSDGDGDFTMYIRVSDPTLPGPDTITFTQSGRSVSVIFTITSPTGGGGTTSKKQAPPPDPNGSSPGGGSTSPTFVCVNGPNGGCGN